MTMIKSYFSLTKPKVVVLLQITALCSVLSHDLLEQYNFSFQQIIETSTKILVVFIGGYLTAGGANAINMWYDRDIDPIMRRTSNRAIPSGKVSPNNALIFGVFISIIGVAWFVVMANQVAAFWAAFSIFFYVFIYTAWLKRSTVQNIVIGGIAGSTPPVIGWAAASDDLSIKTDSAINFFDSIFSLGSFMPWFLFLLIFLWTPPHFWALALYRSEEYERVNIPMMPGIKGPEKTLFVMKIYVIILVLLSFLSPFALNNLEFDEYLFHIFCWTNVILSTWYASTVFKIDLNEQKDKTGRIPTAARSFWVSMLYLALIFVAVVMASIGTIGGIIGALISTIIIIRNQLKAKKEINPFSS
ncbi:MAG: protoheme IX farnesyltransferase [Euryarchaeota archaeon]|nr:protoheme IX farnesyltransferase [Euryarchaeota archaeon]MBT4391047.1 protoheme IX farnesyltransferase [Euryarchaeota archaeon]MBT4802151.1 protoheme IX farnesyltransferase [Euryarchaeota archaeon]MBT5613926.1 protoheme IX farnesyltransferase [Euryarchaeota archaeon]MBT6684243.1 protoheme IX farnesyltransferase [Euryarchaeota archaeon]